MRLLVVGHTYVTSFAQSKYVAMKSLNPDLEIRLVVPPAVKHSFGEYRATQAVGLADGDLVVMRSIGGSSNMTYAHDPLAMSALMRQFNPTHVHIEEDPHSAVGVETVWLAKRLCPSAAVSFFTWDNLNRTPPFPRQLLKRGLTRFGFSRADLIVCGNRQAQSLLSSKGYHGRSDVIPQIGLDGEGASRSQGVRTHGGDAPEIGYFGRLVEEKGILDLLHALDRLRDRPWRLTIRGEGPLRRDIATHWAQRLGDRLQILETVPHANVAGHLQQMDIFVLPSYSIPTWKEQFGLTLAQAMLAGCACIGSTCGAIPDVLDGHGIVFAERDVAQLSEALRRLIASPADRALMAASGQRYAAARYTSEPIARRYLRAFEAISN